MVLVSLPDIVGTGSTIPLSTHPVGTKYVQVSVDITGDRCRAGGPEVSISRGMPIPPGGSQFFPMWSANFEGYDLRTIYLYVPDGTTVYVLYAV